VDLPVVDSTLVSSFPYSLVIVGFVILIVDVCICLVFTSGFVAVDVGSNVAELRFLARRLADVDVMKGASTAIKMENQILYSIICAQ